MSVTQLCDFGYKCTFTKDDVVVTSLDGNDHIFTGFRHEDVYLVDFATTEANLSTCTFSQSSLVTIAGAKSKELVQFLSQAIILSQMYY